MKDISYPGRFKRIYVNKTDGIPFYLPSQITEIYPIIDSIINHMKINSKEILNIGNKEISKEIILPGRFKRVYVGENEGKIFFGGKQLFELDPSNKKYLSLTHHANRIKQQLELKENMILITCSGTIGKVILTPQHFNGWTANQHIIRIIPSSEAIAGYISIFLSSEYGIELIKRHIYGSVVDEIDDIHVSQIPILNNSKVQKEINEIALLANKKRYQAYLDEQEALREGISMLLDIQIYKDNLDFILKELARMVDAKVDPFIKSQRLLNAKYTRSASINTYLVVDMLERLLSEGFKEEYDEAVKTAREKASLYVNKEVPEGMKKEDILDYYEIGDIYRND